MNLQSVAPRCRWILSATMSCSDPPYCGHPESLKYQSYQLNMTVLYPSIKVLLGYRFWRQEERPVLINDSLLVKQWPDITGSSYRNGQKEVPPLSYPYHISYAAISVMLSSLLRKTAPWTRSRNKPGLKPNQTNPHSKTPNTTTLHKSLWKRKKTKCKTTKPGSNSQ